MKISDIKPVLLIELGVNEDLLTRALEYIENSAQGDIIFYEELINDFHFSGAKSLRFLVALSREEIVEEVYRLFCPDCENFHPGQFLKFSEFEDIEECPYCSSGYQIDENPYKNLSIQFRKA